MDFTEDVLQDRENYEFLINRLQNRKSIILILLVLIAYLVRFFLHMNLEKNTQC